VAAPRRIEFNKDVLFLVEDQLLKVSADEFGNGAVLGLGLGLALHVRSELAVDVVLDKFGQRLGGDLCLLVVRVFAVVLVDLQRGARLIRIKSGTKQTECRTWITKAGQTSSRPRFLP